MTIEERDDGFAAVGATGRPVAHVTTKEIGERHDPRLKFPEKTVRDLVKEEWRVHFTGGRFTVAEVAELAAILTT